MLITLQFNQFLQEPETYVAAVKEAVKSYEVDIESMILVKTKAKLWALAVKPFKAVQVAAYIHTNTKMFSNLAILLKNLLILLVPNAEAERSFSTLKRVNRLRASEWFHISLHL